MRLASHLTSTTDKVESTVSNTLVKGVGKLKAFEHDVHIRVKHFQRKVALLSVAGLVAILGLGVWALSAYKGFSEIMSPAWAAFITGSILFAVCGLLIYLAQKPTVMRYGLNKLKT